MPQSSSVTPAHETGVSGTRVIRSIRRLIIVAAVAVFGYATFMTASKGACTASAAAEDGYRCATLNLRPSALVSIDRAATVIVIVVLTSFVVSQIWFRLIPLEQWDGTGTLYYPFPFGSVDLTVD